MNMEQYERINRLHELYPCLEYARFHERDTLVELILLSVKSGQLRFS